MIAALILRHRLPLALAAAVLALLMAFGWAWNGWSAEKALRKADRAAYVSAQAEASRIAKAALDHAEARYKEKARAADEKTVLAVVAADAATADYARRMRVKAPSCGASAAVAEAPRYGPRFSAPMPADTLVAVSDADLQACAVNTATLLQAREWALSLSE